MKPSTMPLTGPQRLAFWTSSASHRKITNTRHLIDTFGLSKRERASRLLHFWELGGDKPSSLMDEMLALLGDHPPCFLFEQLFLERLSEDVRIQLVDAKFDDCRQLAKHADALWVSRDIGFSTNAVQSNRPTRQKKKDKPSTPTQDDVCYYH